MEKGGGAGAGADVNVGVLGFLGSSDFGGNEDGKLALKQAQVIERQTAKNQLRQQEIARAREEAAKSSNPGESPAAFLDKFSAERCQLEVGLHALSARRRGAAGEVETDLTGLQQQQQLAEMTDSLTRLKESLAVSSYFLPRFDLRNCQAAVSKLEEDLAAAGDQIAPKKKFTFASKKKKGPGRTTADGSQPQSSPSVAAEKTSSAPLFVAASSPRMTSSASPTANRTDNEAKLGKGLTGVKGAVLVKDSDDLVSGDYTLADLVNCDVYLRGTLSALFIHNLRNCKVYSGPVTGAVHVDGASGCVFMLASHQIRIHSTKQSDFYLRVRSGPIIEHTAGARFAPYAFRYVGIEADLRDAGLADEMGLWEKVEDFGWLRAAKSPNWSWIPVSERLPPVDGSEVGTSQSRQTLSSW